MSTHKRNPALRLDSAGELDSGTAAALLADGVDAAQSGELADELVRRGRARVESWDLPGAGLERITGMSAEYALLVAALEAERERGRQSNAALAGAYVQALPHRTRR